jgi:hypothetical protein
MRTVSGRALFRTGSERGTVRSSLTWLSTCVPPVNLSPSPSVGIGRGRFVAESQGAPRSRTSVDALVELVRDVADAGNQAVGRGVLLSAIPRRAIEAPTGITLASMPITEMATFKYFPEGSLEGIDKGPEVANPGGFRTSDFWARTDSAGNQIVQFSFRVPDLSGS